MNLKSLDTTALKAELKRRERNAKTLIRKRDKLAKQLAEVEAELAALGSTGGGGRGPGRPKGSGTGPRKRAKNKVSLADALAQAMEVRAVVSPSEAADLVRENGYKSTSKHFGMMVSNALSKDKRFKRVSRG
ncbi:MAG: hypothetical protein ACYTCU_05225, partial [Planctomycetota bacterium]